MSCVWYVKEVDGLYVSEEDDANVETLINEGNMVLFCDDMDDMKTLVERLDGRIHMINDDD